MKTVGFPISTKENEFRRTLVPQDINSISHPECIYVEDGFGSVLGIENEEYIKKGCNICSHSEVLTKDIICDPKIGDANYLDKLKENTIIFGWIHATQNKDITDKIVNNKLTAYAWEKMYEDKKHVFSFNNELAGEGSILNAIQYYGKLPYNLNAAVIGRGNTARGAVHALSSLGANVDVYTRDKEQELRDNIGKYDIIANCILWDTTRKDHIIYRSDLSRMKKDSMIVDVSCDRNGGIETTIPTTISEPTYVVDGILHYAVDHTPSIFYKTFSYENSKVIVRYIDDFINQKENEVLNDCLIIDKGIIVDNDINVFQNR